jgi:hypothetical protein
MARANDGVPMRLNEEMLIRVHGSWDGWQNAEVRLGNLRGVHWFQPDRAPHQLLYGFVSCADLVNGFIPHACDQATAPHDLLVCVLKRHVVPSAYAELVRSAAEYRPSVPLSTKGEAIGSGAWIESRPSSSRAARRGSLA